MYQPFTKNELGRIIELGKNAVEHLSFTNDKELLRNITEIKYSRKYHRLIK